MKNHGFTPIIILLIVILALGVVGYFAYRNGYVKTPVQEETSSTTPTSSLSSAIPRQSETTGKKRISNRYENSKFGYEFVYPSDFKLTEETTDHVSISNNLPPDPNCVGGGCHLGTPRLSIYFEYLGNPDEKSMSLDQYANKQRSVALDWGGKQSGITKIYKFGTDVRFFEGYTAGYNHNYLFMVKDQPFSVTVVFPSKGDVPTYQLQADQILSTFKFNQ